MPKILDSAIKKIQKNGRTKEEAYAIAIATLEKAKILDKNGKLTTLGIARQKLGSKGRALQSVAETKKSIRKKPLTKKK